MLAEKPDSARKIALALASKDNSLSERHGLIDVPQAFDNRHYVVSSAFGHLYQLVDPNQFRPIFPILDIDWFSRSNSSSGKCRRGYKHVDWGVRTRLEIISQESLASSSIVNACDYDLEGEIIGFNALVLCRSESKKKLEIFRAKFSTLTNEELRDSFRNLFRADQNFSCAGRIRHLTDFVWGVNLSRALSFSTPRDVGKSNQIITIGRVQGPTLSFVIERELARTCHVPVPSWSITCQLEKSGIQFSVRYLDSPLHSHEAAERIYKGVSTAETATADNVSTATLSVPPRYPFDLGELQKEAHRIYRLSPSLTLSICQKLYLDTLISYPRTDSQKLPPRTERGNILEKLSTQGEYAGVVSRLLQDPRKRSSPVEGPKDDPAHPAIFPTGEKPRLPLTERERQIYDLIVRRYFNVFSPNQLVEEIRTIFKVSSFDFVVEHHRIVDEGWTFYYPFGRSYGDSSQLSFTGGEKLVKLSQRLKEEYDPSPPRYSESTLLAEMERKELGTKATRAETIATLIERSYIEKSGLELKPTSRGSELANNLERLCSEITSIDLTRNLERGVEGIRLAALDEVDFAIDLLQSLRPAITRYRHQEMILPLGKLKEVDRTKSLGLGPCSACKTGKLQLIRSPKTGKRFILCTNSSNGCKSSSPAIPKGKIIPLGEKCPKCKWPLISMSYDGHRSVRACSNYRCTKGELK